MIVTNAVWEKENLGVQVVEIKLESTDEPKKIGAKLKEYEGFSGVVSVSVPAGECDAQISVLEKFGFHFAEAQLDCGFRLSEQQQRHLQKMIEKLPEYEMRRIVSQEDCERICAEIRKGIFTEERFAKDPHFGLEKANNRMANWLYTWFVQDKLVLHELYEKQTGKPLAFGSGYVEKSTMVGHLKGVYLGVEDLFAGTAIDLLGFEYMYRRGDIRRFKTTYSSNNHRAIHMAQEMGIQVQKIRYLYTRFYE